MTQDNTEMLKQQGYDYICVTRAKLKDYTAINPEQDRITIYGKNKNPIGLQYVAKKDCPDNYLYLRSRQKAVKEALMNEHFSQRYEEELENIKGALHKKGAVKGWKKYGSASAGSKKYSCKFYNQSLSHISNSSQDIMIAYKFNLRFKKNEKNQNDGKPSQNEAQASLIQRE